MVENRELWRVGDLARETGITVRALHHYNHLGLLTPSSHTSGGHRCYTDEDVRRLHRIIALRSFGLSLREIAAVFDAEPDFDPADLIRRQLVVVEERIRQTTDLQSRLLGVLDALDGTVEPSTKQFLQLIEETVTMAKQFSAEQVEGLIENRRNKVAQLDAHQFSLMSHRRDQKFVGMSAEERQQLKDHQHAAKAARG